MADDKVSEKLISSLVQKLSFSRQIKLDLFEDRLDFTWQDLTGHSRLRFYLNKVKREPDVILKVPIWSIVLFLVFVSCSIFLILNMSSLYYSIPLSITAVTSFYFLYRILFKTGKYLTLYYTATGPFSIEPTLFLVPDKPSKDQVDKFIQEIKSQQEKYQDKLESNEYDSAFQYISEIKRFHELEEKGVVTESEFQVIKAKLLDLKPKRIGFRM